MNVDEKVFFVNLMADEIKTAPGFDRTTGPRWWTRNGVRPYISTIANSPTGLARAPDDGHAQMARVPDLDVAVTRVVDVNGQQACR